MVGSRSPTLDLVLIFIAAVFSYFLLPNVIMVDGGLALLGFDYGRFMPKAGLLPKLHAPLPKMGAKPTPLEPVPPEIAMLINHLVSAFGACGLAFNAVLVAFALFSSEKREKRLVLICHLGAQLFTTAVAMARPPGTGADGSPAGGPLPLQLTLMAISFVGIVYG